MSFVSSSGFGKILAFAGLTVALAACQGGGGTQTNLPPAAPVATPFPTTYSLLQTITPPKSASFDIGFVDETNHLYTLADRSTNGIDVVNALTSAYLGTAGARR